MTATTRTQVEAKPIWQANMETWAADAVTGWWRRLWIKSKEQKQLDKLVARAMRRSLHSQVGRAFERTDAYVWLLNADGDKSVSGEVARIHHAAQDAIRRHNHEQRVTVYTDPLRIEIEKPKPQIVTLRSYGKQLGRLPKNQFSFVPGVRQRVSDHVLHEMSLADAEVAQLLIAGATGSGKTMLATTILTTMALLNSPETLALLVIDPKRVDIGNTDMQRLPHLAHRVITDPALGVAAVYRLATEMERRATEIDWHTERQQRWKMDGRIFCYIDELHELVDADSGVLDVLAWIAAQGRGLGIHLGLATQRPTVDIMPGHLRSNLPARFGGWVRDASNASIAIGLPETELEKLHGSGLFRLYTRATGVLLQGLYIDLDHDLPSLVNSIVEQWQGKQPLWTIDSLAPGAKAPESVLDTVKAQVTNNWEVVLLDRVIEKLRQGATIGRNEMSRMRQDIDGKQLGSEKAKEIRDRAAAVLAQETAA